MVSVAKRLVWGQVGLWRMTGTPCRTLWDAKRVCPIGRSRYPAVTVDSRQLQPDASVVGGAAIAVEVLSPGIRATDYLEKPRDYGTWPTMQVYLIVDPDSPRIDGLRCTTDDLELAEQAEGREAVIELAPIGARLALEEIYPPAG